MRRTRWAAKALRLFGGLITLAAVGTSRPIRAQSPAAQRFIGTWRLVSIEVNGQPDPARGAHPIGLIYYDATNHMAAQIAPDRPRPTWSADTQPSPEQAKEALTGYVAYFGTYTVDEGAHTVTHHRQAAINLNVVDFVRRFEFDTDGRLILTPLENPRTRLVWERLK